MGICAVFHLMFIIYIYIYKFFYFLVVRWINKCAVVLMTTIYESSYTDVIHFFAVVSTYRGI